MIDVLVRVALDFLKSPETQNHTVYPAEVWVTTPSNEIEVSGLCHNWLRGLGMELNIDYIYSWKTVTGERDHYRFAFKTEFDAILFERRWKNYLIN